MRLNQHTSTSHSIATEAIIECTVWHKNACNQITATTKKTLVNCQRYGRCQKPGHEPRHNKKTTHSMTVSTFNASSAQLHYSLSPRPIGWNYYNVEIRIPHGDRPHGH